MDFDFEISRGVCVNKVGFAIAGKVNDINDNLMKVKKPYSHA